MNQFFKKTLIAVSCASFLFLSACNDNDNDNDWVITAPVEKYYVAEKPYVLDQLENASSISTMTYRMENVQGKKADATALVFFPKTAQPQDGWRMVVWEHGTVGSGDSCAPSNNPFDDSFKTVATSLLAAGYVIVAPDYEGLGTPGLHPFLNLGSAAKSAQFAITAVQEKHGERLNGKWMSVGNSQGGHASLATAEFANADTKYKGAVAGAPASSIVEIITEIAPDKIQALVDAGKQLEAITLYSQLLSFASYTSLGLKAVDPGYDFTSIFESRSAQIAEYAEGTTGENGLCVVPLATKFVTDIASYLLQNPGKSVLDYPGLKPGFQDDPLIKKYLAENQPGTQKINSPVMIIQGTLDEIVPFEITDRMQKAMSEQGTDVTFVSVEGGSHAGAIVEKYDDLVEFIQVEMPAT